MMQLKLFIIFTLKKITNRLKWMNVDRFVKGLRILFNKWTFQYNA